MAYTVSATNEAQGEWPLVDPGLYRAIVTEIMDGPTTYGPSVRIIFTIQADITGDEYYKDERVSGMASLKMNISKDMESKLYRWYRAIMGRTLAEGEAVDLEEMLGRPCIIKGDQRASSTGRVYANVTDVTPLPSRRANAPARREAPAEEPSARETKRTRPAPASAQDEDYEEELPF